MGTQRTKPPATKPGPSIRTSQLTASDAQICRDLNWQPGTRLAAVDAPRLQIVITAIGRRQILAEQIHCHGGPLEQSEEHVWRLTSRDWIPISFPSGPRAA